MVITNVKIESMGNSDFENGYIRTSGKYISEIANMSDYYPIEGEEKFDFAGCIAFPGLIDAHSHLGLFGDAMGIEGDDGNETSDPATPQLRAIDGINVLDKGFSEALEYGITTVVTGPGSANPISGQSAALKTLGNCVDDMIIVPALAMKMALGENPKNTYAGKSQAPITRMATAAIIREELFRARRYLDDMMRSEEDEDIDPPEFDIKSEALLPVLKGDMPVHIHAHRADDIFTAVRIIKEFSLKGVIVHATEAHLVAERFSKEGIPVIIGPILGTRSKPELAGMSRSSAASLYNCGVKLAICTDHPEMPQEMLMLSAAIANREGMPREAALRAVTIEAAEICGLSDSIGSLEIGKDADIVIFKNDPIFGFEKPKAVFLNGNLAK